MLICIGIIAGFVLIVGSLFGAKAGLISLVMITWVIATLVSFAGIWFFWIMGAHPVSIIWGIIYLAFVIKTFFTKQY